MLPFDGKVVGRTEAELHVVEGAEQKLGMRSDVAEFVLPLTVMTFKMNYVISQPFKLLFLVSMLGLQLRPGFLITFMATVFLLSFTTVGIPSGGQLLTWPLLLSAGIPIEALVMLKVADAITAFAGSMNFVYIHAVLFAVWMLAFERSPWPTLTLVVSLEAIFLSTFVMIGQNRQAAFQQAKADHDYQEEEHLLGENTDLTRMIHQLTTDIHQHVWERRPHRRPAHSLRRCDATRRGLCWCVRAARVVGVRCRGGRVRVGGR